MKISHLAALVALAGLAMSSAANAAWYAKYDGVKGSTQSTTQLKKADGLKAEQGVIEDHSRRSSKPKEIVVVGSKSRPAGWDPKKKKRIISQP